MIIRLRKKKLDIKKEKTISDEDQWFVELPRNPKCSVCNQEIEKLGLYYPKLQYLACNKECQCRIKECIQLVSSKSLNYIPILIKSKQKDISNEQKF